MPDFTPTQLRILNVLSDGLPHRREELHKCLADELANISAIRKHLCDIRKLLRPIGEDVICEWVNRSWYYRHVRLLASAVNGKR